MDFKVGIILINYNNYQDTIECIESIEHCTYPYYRIYVVDNASVNQSAAELSKRFHDVRIIENKINAGFSSGNNIGIEQALRDGMDFVLLLNNDTIVEPDFLNKLMNPFNRHSNIGLATGKILYYSKPDSINVAGGRLSLFKGKAVLYGEGKKDDAKYDKEIEVSFASGCMQLISREVLEKVGAYNEEYFLYYEDADYCNRIRMNGYKMIYTPESKIYHKVSSSTGGALSDSVLYYNVRNRLLFVKKNMIHWYQRIIFIIYYLFTASIRYLCLNKRQRRVYKKAIKDFFDGITGGSYESSHDE